MKNKSIYFVFWKGSLMAALKTFRVAYMIGNIPADFTLLLSSHTIS